MKYCITIDAATNEITAEVVCPRFLRTGDESKEELVHRGALLRQWEQAETPDWLQDTVDYLQDRLECYHKSADAKHPKDDKIIVSEVFCNEEI